MKEPLILVISLQRIDNFQEKWTKNHSFINVMGFSSKKIRFFFQMVYHPRNLFKCISKHML